MKVKINEVIKESAKNFVAFTTEYGNAKGIWDGDMPDVDKEYFVELEIEGTLIWGIILKKLKKRNVPLELRETLYT